ELVEVGGRLDEFDQIAMSSGCRRPVGKHRPYMKIADACLCRRCSGGHGSFYFLADQVFAKGGEEVFGPAGKAKKGRLPSFETDRIPYDITPQAGARSENDGVLDADFKIDRRMSGRLDLVQILDRDELKEDAVIRDQPQQIVS